MLKNGRPFFVKVLPVVKVFDGINAARTMFDICWFDKVRCHNGLNHLKTYHYEIDERIGMYKPTPEEDASVHCADAFRYVACAYYQLTSKGDKEGRDPGKLYVDDIMKEGLDKYSRTWVEY
jgi:hypothetical protein